MQHGSVTHIFRLRRREPRNRETDPQNLTREGPGRLKTEEDTVETTRQRQRTT